MTSVAPPGTTSTVTPIVGHQVAQAPSALGEAMLAVSHHFLISHESQHLFWEHPLQDLPGLRAVPANHLPYQIPLISPISDFPSSCVPRGKTNGFLQYSCSSQAQCALQTATSNLCPNAVSARGRMISSVSERERRCSPSRQQCNSWFETP